jgi:hypothetical protein
MAGIKMHKRFMHVQYAKAQVATALDDLKEKHKLTDIEMMRALLGYMQTELKFMLRTERHPDDPDKQADVA